MTRGIDDNEIVIPGRDAVPIVEVDNIHRTNLAAEHIAHIERRNGMAYEAGVHSACISGATEGIDNITETADMIEVAMGGDDSLWHNRIGPTDGCDDADGITAGPGINEDRMIAGDEVDVAVVAYCRRDPDD